MSSVIVRWCVLYPRASACIVLACCAPVLSHMEKIYLQNQLLVDEWAHVLHHDLGWPDHSKLQLKLTTFSCKKILSQLHVANLNQIHAYTGEHAHAGDANHIWVPQCGSASLSWGHKVSWHHASWVPHMTSCMCCYRVSFQVNKWGHCERWGHCPCSRFSLVIAWTPPPQLD